MAVKYTNQNAIRNQNLSNDLYAILEEVGRREGVNFEVYSGGQAEKGSGGNRTGSTRHDLGNAADVKIFRVGDDGSKNYISFDNTEGQQIWKNVIQTSVALGATGVGAASDYMGSQSAHIGFGTPAAWGAGGKSANAPSWVTEAWQAGRNGQAASPAVAPVPSPALARATTTGTVTTGSPDYASLPTAFTQPQTAYAPQTAPQQPTSSAAAAAEVLARGGQPQSTQGIPEKAYETIRGPATAYQVNLDAVLDYARQTGQLTGLGAMLPNSALHGEAQKEIAKQLPPGATFDPATNTIHVQDVSILENPPIDPNTGKPADFASYIQQGLAKPVNQGETRRVEAPYPAASPNRALLQRETAQTQPVQVASTDPGIPDYALKAMGGMSPGSEYGGNVLSGSFQTLQAQPQTAGVQGAQAAANALAAAKRAALNGGQTTLAPIPRGALRAEEMMGQGNALNTGPQIGNTPAVAESTPSAEPARPRYTYDSNVEQLQRALSAMGYNTGGADGYFGPNTESAVRAFQRDSGLKTDGIVGSRTLGALQAAQQAQAQAAAQAAQARSSSSSQGSRGTSSNPGAYPGWEDRKAEVYNSLRSSSATSSRDNNDVSNYAGKVATGRLTENQARSLLYAGAP